jgi:hypothetical protein
MAGHLGWRAGLGAESRLESPLYLGGDCPLPIASCLLPLASCLMILMSKSLAAGLIVGGWGGAGRDVAGERALHI